MKMDPKLTAKRKSICAVSTSQISGMIIHVESMPKKVKDVDDLLKHLGDPGLFQIIQFALLCAQFIPLAMSDLMPIFYGLDPNGLIVDAGVGGNHSSNALLGPHNKTDNTEGIVQNLTDFQTSGDCRAHGLDLEKSDYVFVYKQEKQRSVIGDMNLICDRTWLVGFSTTMYYLGQIVASPGSGWLADTYGRRPILLCSNAFYTALSIGLIFSQDYVTFIIIRFLIGMVRQAMNTSFYVLMMEGIPPQRRISWAAMAQFPFSAGVLSLALAAYLLQNWHHIQIVLALSNCLAIGLIWFAPESLKWLLFQHRIADAQAIYKRIATFNGLAVEPEYLEDLRKTGDYLSAQKGHTKTYSILDCFRTFHIRFYTMLCCFIWAAILIQYFGMMLLLSHTYGDIYVNFAISAALELIPRVLALFLTYRLDNRTTMMGYFLVGGSLAIISGIIPAENAVLKTVLSLLARMSVVGCFALAYTFTSELFPTAIRNQGFGLCSMAMRVGSMIAPQIAGLARSPFKGLPFVIIGGVSILAALATALLPETKGLKMVATVEEAEKLGDTSSWMGSLRRLSSRRPIFRLQKTESTTRIT